MAVRAARQAAAGHVPVLASLGPFSAITDDLLAITAAADLGFRGRRRRRRGGR